MMRKSLVISTKYLWEYLAIIAIILECSSVYFNQINGFPISANYTLLIGFLPLALWGLMNMIPKRESHRYLFGFVTVYLLFAILYAITLGKAELMNFLMKFGVIFPCIGIYVLYLIDSCGFRRFASRFVKIVSLIAIVSLIIWFFGPICGIIKPTGSIVFTWGNMAKRASSYFNIQFETQVEQTVFGLCRNTAFFTEAPKYGLILSIAYIFNYMLEGDKRIAMLFFVTIVSTFSFTAIIAIILLHFIEYSMNVGKDVLSQKARLRTIIWPIVIGIVLIIAFFLMSNKLDTSSGVGRVGDFVVCFSVGLKHPLFGWGFMDNEYLNTVLHTSRLASGVGNTMGLSNSICQIFVDGGLYMLLFYLFPLMVLILFGKKHNKKILSAGLVLLYFFVTTYFAYTGIMFFVLSLGYVFFLYRKSVKLEEFVEVGDNE